MVPPVTAPRSAASNPEAALRVVVLPAPLPPSRATIAPGATLSETPRRATMMPSYAAWTLSRTSRGGAPGGSMVVMLGSFRRLPGSARGVGLAGAIARLDPLFAGVLRRRCLDDRPQHGAVRVDPVADGHPLLT